MYILASELWKDLDIGQRKNRVMFLLNHTDSLSKSTRTTTLRALLYIVQGWY